MKTICNSLIVVMIIMICSFNLSCTKEPETEMFIKEKVTGYVQKGPFYNGTSVELTGLDNAFEPIDNIINSTITNNAGTFEFNNISISTEYAEIKANGYYFNEVTGTISPDQLTLKVVTDLNDNSSANINVLTHLESDRIAFLVNSGMTFSEAQDSAQQQVLEIFGLRNLSIGKSEDLDISSGNEGDGILLAVSVIMQGQRDVEELSELLDLISSDLGPDGILDRTYLLPSLRNSTEVLNMAAIRSNIYERYQEIGISSVIPAFEQCLSSFLLKTGVVPTAETKQANNISITGVTLNGIINANNLNTNVTFEYGPDINYGHTITGSPGLVTGNTSTFVKAEVSGLTGGTTYHYRVVTSDASGTGYGNDIVFRMYNSDAVTDIENNYYNVITTGNQVWLSENLKTTKLNDGSVIQHIQSDSEWAAASGPGFSWPGNNEISSKDIYGALYNWNTVNTGRLCPAGWHVPTEGELDTLSDFSGGVSLAGGNLKESGTSHWFEPNTGATNSNGFSSLPAGFRSSEGSIMPPGYNCYFWSSTQYSATEAWRFALSYLNTELAKHSRNKAFGYSVRCIKNTE